MLKKSGKIVVLDSIPCSRRNVDKGRDPAEVTIPHQEGDENLTKLPNLPLPEVLEKRLFPHQKYGVNWMYRLHINGVGGLLGDEMGLGKTFQIVSLLTGLLLKNEIKRILIISPVSVLHNWEKEIREHLLPHIPRVRLDSINADVNKKKRINILISSSSRLVSSIIVSSHQIVSNMIEEFAKDKWDYVILDEGHVIKNPQTKLWKSLSQLPSKHRILCTGTPIQNNLAEFWALMDWATKGTVFGSAKNFASNIADPIAKGQDPQAKPDHKESALEAIRLLVNLTKPVLLQRKKKEKFASSILKLPNKKELVVWISLSTEQRSMYSQYVNSGKFRSILTQASYPVEVINYLRTLCRHALLLECSTKKAQLIQQTKKQQSNFFVDDDFDEEDEINNLTQSMSAMNMTSAKNALSSDYIFDILGYTPTVERILRGSIKLRVLIKLISNLLMINDEDDNQENVEAPTDDTDPDHRVLVFSQSKLMLQIIQYLLAEHGIPCFMIDGSTPAKDRQAIINEFNCTESDYTGPRICLLTTKACGVGITLTAADRVIIFDPSWNPAEDSQAVDRVYRIGQTKDVIVYRFIMAACVEEKIYEKQVFKEGLRVVSEKGLETEKYFKGKSQLFDLLSLRQSEADEKGNQSLEIFDLIANHPDDLKYDGLDNCYGIVGCTRHDELYYADSISNNSENTKKEQKEGDSQKIDPEVVVVESISTMKKPLNNPLMSQHAAAALRREETHIKGKGSISLSQSTVTVIDDEETEWSDTEMEKPKEKAFPTISRSGAQAQKNEPIIDLTQEDEEEDEVEDDVEDDVEEEEDNEDEADEEEETEIEDNQALDESVSVDEVNQVNESTQMESQGELTPVCKSEKKFTNILFSPDEEEPITRPKGKRIILEDDEDDDFEQHSIAETGRIRDDSSIRHSDAFTVTSEPRIPENTISHTQITQNSLQSDIEEDYVDLCSVRSEEILALSNLTLNDAIGGGRESLISNHSTIFNEVIGAEPIYEECFQERRQTIRLSLLRALTPPLSEEPTSHDTAPPSVSEADHYSFLSHTIIDSEEGDYVGPERFSLMSTGTLIASPESHRSSEVDQINRRETIELTQTSILTENTLVSDCEMSQKTIAGSSASSEVNDVSLTETAYGSNASRRETIELSSHTIRLSQSTVTASPVSAMSERQNFSMSVLTDDGTSSEYNEDYSMSRQSLDLFEIKEIVQSYKQSQDEEYSGFDQALSRQTTIKSETSDKASTINDNSSQKSEQITFMSNEIIGKRDDSNEVYVTRRKEGRFSGFLADYCDPDIFLSPSTQSQFNYSQNVSQISCSQENELIENIDEEDEKAEEQFKPDAALPKFEDEEQLPFAPRSIEGKENAIIEKNTSNELKIPDYATPRKVRIYSPEMTTPSLSTIKIKAISTTKKKDRVLQQLSGRKARQSSNRDSFLCFPVDGSPLNGSTKEN